MNLRNITSLIFLFFFFNLYSQKSIERRNQFYPKTDKINKFVKSPYLHSIVPELLDFNDERLLRLDESLKIYTPAQRKLFLWNKFSGLEQCGNCTHGGCFVERFLVPFEEEIVSFYKEIGYLDEDVATIQEYFDDINAGRIYRHKRLYMDYGDRLKLVNQFIIKHFDSLIRDLHGNKIVIDYNFSGWVRDTTATEIIKNLMKNGKTIESYKYDLDNTLKEKTVAPKYHKYWFYTNGQIKKELFYSKSKSGKKITLIKEYYQSGQLFKESEKEERFSKPIKKLFYKNGSPAYEQLYYGSTPKAWDSTGITTIIDETGYITDWELIDGKLKQKSYTRYENGLRKEFKNLSVNRNRSRPDDNYKIISKTKYIHTRIYRKNDKHVYKEIDHLTLTDSIFYQDYGLQIKDLYRFGESLVADFKITFDNKKKIRNLEVEPLKHYSDRVFIPKIEGIIRELKFQNFPKIGENETLVILGSLYADKSLKK